jgi:hypothetical protein
VPDAIIGSSMPLTTTVPRRAASAKSTSRSAARAASRRFVSGSAAVGST